MNLETAYGALPIPLQNLACTWAGRKRARARFTPYFFEMLDRWTETGMSSAEALREIQQDRLLDLVRPGPVFRRQRRIPELILDGSD